MTNDFASRAYGALGELEPGSRIAGYVIEERIGAGGTAVVFRARDEVLQRLAAVKVIAAPMASDPEFRTRFLRESRAAATVDSPHIIPVYGAGEAEGLLYIATRFVAGGDLAGLLRGCGGRLAPGRAAFLVEQVGSALDAAHAAGLVHRDVKPHNILVDTALERPEHAFLCDFGLSKGTLSPTRLTVTGQFLGTPAYCAPEQVMNGSVDGRADQYALACVAFTLLTGKPPFDRGEAMATLFAQVHDPVPAVTALRPELPAAVDGVIARALAKSPADRYGNCAGFAEALRAALVPAQPTVPALHASPPPPVTEGAMTALGSAGHASTITGGWDKGQLQGPVSDAPGRRPPRRIRRAALISGTAAMILAAAGIIYAVHPFGNSHRTSELSPPLSPQSSTQSAAPGTPITLPDGGIADSVQFSADGKFMAATSSNPKYSSKIYLLNTQTNSLVATLTVPTVTVGTSADPPLIVNITFGADDASLSVTVMPNLSGHTTLAEIPYLTYQWNLGTDARALVHSFNAKNTVNVYFSGDGQTVAEEPDGSDAVFFFRTIDFRTAVAAPHPITLTSDANPADSADGLDVDGNRLVSEDSQTNMAQVWDVENGRLLGSVPDETIFYTPYLSPDGKTIEEVPVQGSVPGAAKPTLWDVATQSNITPSDPRWQEQSTAGAFSSDGSVFWTGRSGKADVWDVATGKYLFSITTPVDGENELLLGPGGNEAVFLGSPSSLKGNAANDATEYRQIYIWRRG